MSPLLATGDFSIEKIVMGAGLVGLLALLLSYWPAARGHWAAPVLAAPGLIAGVLLLILFAGPHVEGWLTAVAAIPVLLGIGSLVLWRQRKKRRDRRSAETESSRAP